MKRSRGNGDEGEDAYDTREYKHLKGAQLPSKIEALPHIMKRIDDFAMPPEAAAKQAAANNQIDRLQKLLPQLRDKMAAVAPAINGIAATHGHWNIIILVHEWGAPEDEKTKEVKVMTECGGSLTKSIAGGALRLGDDDIVSTIFQLVGDYYGHLRWAARHGSLPVLKAVIGACCMDSLYEAMGIAAANGHLEMIKYLHEECGDGLLDIEAKSDSDNCPLAIAIRRGQVELAKYLYANKEYVRKSSLHSVKLTAATCGPLELVKLFHNDGLYDSTSLSKGFKNAAGSGKIEIVEYLRSKRGCNNSSFDRAFMNAARYGKIEAMEYLYGLDEHKASPTCAVQAFTAAACNGLLDAVKFLDRKEEFSADAFIETFTRIATYSSMDLVGARRRVNVMEFLHSKGCTSPEKTSETFVVAAHTKHVDVIKYLYTKAPHSPSVVNEAFKQAVFLRNATIVKFLNETGSVSSTAAEMLFLSAVNNGRMYDVEFIYECGCTSQSLVEQALREKRIITISRSMDALLRQYLKE